MQILYILDAYHGLFTININKKIITHIFNSTTCSNPINKSSYNSNIKNKVKEKLIEEDVYNQNCHFFNDLDITDDGNICYFTDSSYKHSRRYYR